MSMVLYCLEGAHVAEFAHVAFGTPGLMATQQCYTTSILALSAFPTLDEIESNIGSVYG